MTSGTLNLAPPIARHAETHVRAALQDTRIVSIVGPRQSGKTTLARQISEPGRPFLSLDDDAVRTFAQADPVGFIRQFDTVVIDEFQRVPALVLALKKSVDEDPRPGRFLLTGSADIFATSQSPDSLAGRIETVRLLPLSRAEILGKGPSSFLDRLFKDNLVAASRVEPATDLVDLVLGGGFPEALARTAPNRRRAWFRSYVEALAQRDIPDLAALDKIGVMPRLIEQGAFYSGQIVNNSAIGADLGLDSKTVDHWLVLLENVFLLRRVRPWFRNSFKRLSRMPKLQFIDSGLLAASKGVDAELIARDRSQLGPLLECFVYSELLKMLMLRDHHISISHYRDKDQAEVDFILERTPEQIVGIEVKSAATVYPKDFRGLKRVQDAAGESFACGVVLYDGDLVLPFGPKLYAAPLSMLWM